MEAKLTLFLEGPAADQALASLLALPGLTGEALPELDPPVRDSDWLSLAANLLQVASAPLLARDLWQWFKSRRQRPGAATLSCVIEAPDGTRLNLNSATPDEIAAVLALIARRTPPAP